MMMSKYNRIAGVFLFVLFSLVANGQDYKWSGIFDSVMVEGFYKIILMPEVSGKLNDGMNDLRIKDSQDKEVPYILKSESRFFDKQYFVEYPIVKKEQKKNCCTILEIRNSSKKKIDNIGLVIKNSDVFKTATLSGSDDSVNWYIIKDKYFLQGLYNEGSTEYMQSINFPLSNYEFFKLEISDSSSAPLNILQAGYYGYTSEQGNYTKLPVPSISLTEDSTHKQTIVRVLFDTAYVMDKLSIAISGSKFYNRNASIARKIIGQNKKEFFETIFSFDVSSKHPCILDLNSIRLQEFYLIINNEDNQPLLVKEVEAYQLTRYLLSYLSSNEKYRILFGKINDNTPRYDLSFFEDSIPSIVPAIFIKNIVKTPSPVKEDTDKSFFNSTWWIWLTILVIAILLGFMSVRMLKDMKKQ